MLKTGKYKFDIFKTYYWEGAELEGIYKMPKIKPIQAIPKDVISFSESNKLVKNDKRWVDFFIDDCGFERFWKAADTYFNRLRKAKGIIGTDFSMLPDLLPGQNLWNCTRNRILDFYLQNQGFNVIPVACWCYEKDFDWCFDGLPSDSSIAISSNGCVSSKYAMEIFLKGVEALYKKKNPSNLIVCGRPIKQLEKYNNVHYYPNFNERMRRRIRNGK